MTRRAAREGLRLLLAIACAVLLIALALLYGPDESEPRGCSSDVECTREAGEPEPPAMEGRTR